MSERKTITLRVDPRGRGTFAIDGMEISDSVSGVSIETDVNSANRVTITFIAVNLDAEVEHAEVTEVRP